MALQFLYKEWGSDVWENITDYIQEYPSWNLVLNTEFLSFTFKVMTPKDSEGNKLYPEEGFDICICEDISYTKVFQNLAGKIESIDIENIAYDYDNSDWDVLYTIDCIQRDCSKQPVKLDYKTTTAMNTILDDIIINNTYGNDNLGEGFLGGALSGVQIPKYVNYSANLNIDSVDFSGEPSKAWSDIVRSVNYNWKAIYHVEPDDTYLINLVQQLIFFNNSGLSPEGSSYWSSGITDNTIKEPFQINPKFVSETLTPNQEQYIYLDHGFRIRSNTDKMKNWIDINALIQNGTELLNFTKKGDGSNNTFNLEEKVKDIIYVCRSRVQCNIINVVNTTTFDINTGQAEKIVYDSNLLVQDSLVCKIVSSSITYFRPFTISSNRITLDSAIASLAYNDSFELVNGLDVYETSDADNDRPNYGVIKRAKATEKGSVKFQKYSIPNSVDVVSIWYYPLKDNNIPRIFEDEKKRHGLKYHKEQLDAPTTENELSKYYLGFEKKRKAQKIIKFESQRPDIIETGYQIPVNCSFWNPKYNGLYIATSVACQYDSDYGQAGKPTVTQKVELSNYDDSIINTLISSKNNYSLSTPLVESKNISLFSSELQIMTQIISSNNLPYPDYLEAYYQFNGDMIDISGNSRNGTLWTGSLSTTELYSNVADGAKTPTIPQTVLNGLGDFTFHIRLKLTDIKNNGTDNYYNTIAFCMPGSEFYIYYRQYNGAGNGGWTIAINGGPSTTRFTDTIIEDGLEHDLTISRNGTTGSFSTYIDGDIKNTLLGNSGNLLTTDALSIGCWNGSPSSPSYPALIFNRTAFGGYSNDLLVYSREFTITDISNLIDYLDGL